MPADPYLPPAADVEAAAKAMCRADNLGDPREWDDEDDRLRNVYRKLARIALTTAHARGWRDAAYVAGEREDMASLRRAYDIVVAKLTEARAKLSRAALDALAIDDQATDSLRKLIEAEKDRDAARAEVEAMRKAISYAQTIMADAGYDCAAPIEALARAAVKVAADRDALAERCRVAEAKFTAANQRAIQLERNAILTPNGLAFATVTMERDAAEARAAKLEAALREIANDGEMTFRHAQAIARAALSTADTDGSKT